jgi:hypothetical protein
LLPLRAPVGVRVLSVGAVAGAVVVNVSALLVPPPGAGFTNVICAEPAVATSDAGTCAEALVAVATFVVSAVAPKNAMPPFTKPVPVSVIENIAEPATVDEGVIDASVGDGFVAPTVNVFVPLVPPPGAGLLTAICTVPALARYDAGTIASSCVAEM